MKRFAIMALSALALMGCKGPAADDGLKADDNFEYANERFADLQMLRYKVEGFENLTLKQRLSSIT